MICEDCGIQLVGNVCPSCELYNAAVAAQHAAAESIAKSAHPDAERAWLNQYGVFAWVDGVSQEVAGPNVSAPFVALTQAARDVFRKANRKP